MNRPELYHKTVNILLDAYNNKTLRHQDCTACAVGNLLSPILEEKELSPAEWGNYFCTSTEVIEEREDEYKVVHHQRKQPLMPLIVVERMGLVIGVIESYGYTMKELMKIEYAFETCSDQHNIDHDLEKIKEDDKEWMFLGLCAVLDVLRDIHEVDVEEHEEQVGRFESAFNMKRELVEQ